MARAELDAQIAYDVDSADVVDALSQLDKAMDAGPVPRLRRCWPM